MSCWTFLKPFNKGVINMDVEFVMYLCAAIILTAIASWLVVKRHMDKLMAKMNEAKEFINEHMDTLPPEAKEIANDINQMIDEVKLSFEDGKVSYAEVISMAKQVKELYSGLKKIYDERIVG